MLLDYATYVSRHGKDSEALTATGPHEMVFRADCFTAGTVRHELLHAFFASSPIKSANLNAGQTEEVAAEIMDYHWADYCRLARAIYKGLRK